MLCFRSTKCYLLSSYVNFLNFFVISGHVLCTLLRRRSPRSVRKVWGSDLILEADYRLRTDVFVVFISRSKNVLYLQPISS
jgi:hypothetical protein